MYCISTKARLNSALLRSASSATCRNAWARAATLVVSPAEPNSASIVARWAGDKTPAALRLSLSTTCAGDIVIGKAVMKREFCTN